MGGHRSSASSAPDVFKPRRESFVVIGDCLMSSKPAGQHSGQHTGLGRALSLEIVRVTEGAAVATARTWRGKDVGSGRRRRHAPRTERACDRRHRGDRRGRNGRSADALHWREGRHRIRTEGGHRRRSARGHNALCQEHARRHSHPCDGAGRHAVARARHLHGQNRHRPRLSQKRGRSRRARRGKHRQPRQGQRRQTGGDHSDDS